MKPESRHRCPRCGAPAPYEGNPYRPFCGARCKLMDLGAWLGEEYRIPGEPADGTPGEPETEETKPGKGLA
ncbi:DNA gyrase inhibitor YacG [Dissulfurirhabdus thermomarina]|uniref:DNA gyrase inhibitor YacG n=1 Tax=Dissulfurirhabdus thermomarina TaxID=1765737 RepID=A0A6N9TQX2_DISTH|nr:DNA gyrase inhibitor YacG [Dissulfurirhabdus thermomarina]NDY42134.1 DNA gyrase inhibitor YacG [Dissulfurirhabdus thermomarina]NMX23144.1 DNA gyrase inhibitor YacG [Dissulfurirhabdus thermomarina]